MKKSNTSLAMDASNGMFAYHLIGVMKAVSEGHGECPNPEDEALDYLQIFHADVLEAEEAKINNDLHLTNPSR